MRSAPRSPRWTALAAVALAVTVTAALTACGGTSRSTAAAGSKAGKIAFLLVRTTNIRYLVHDQPEFSERMLDLCPHCTIDIRYAEQDPKLQEAQVKQVLDEGAKVLVLNAASPATAGPLAEMARARGVPVIAHDRLVYGAPVDYYVSFDNFNAGKLQGKALVDAVAARGGGDVLWIDGPASDVNAVAFSAGARESTAGKLTVAAQFQIPGPGWNADQVKAWMHQILPTMAGRKIAGVYSPLDSVSAAAISELKAAGVNPLPAVTGQDSEVAGLQRVMSGQQLMTLYKPFHLEAEKSADLAFDLLQGKKPKGESTVDNKSGQVPTFLLQPVVVTRDNVKSTVVADGFVTATALCAGQYAEACRQLGIS